MRAIADSWRAFRARVDGLWGYDVFIVHRRVDGAGYARALYARLQREGISCFVDVFVYGPGDSLLISTQRHVAKSTALVVVGSAGLLTSPKPIDWVSREIDAYLDSHTGEPAIVVVTFGNPVRENFQGDSVEPPFLAKLRPFLRLDENDAALSAAPSDAVIAAIRNKLRGRRRDRNRLRFFEGTAAALTILLVIAGIAIRLEVLQRRVAETRLRLANSQVTAADARSEINTELDLALRKSADAFDLYPSDDARSALLASLGRAAHVTAFVPCPSGTLAGGVAFSEGAPPEVAFSCVASKTSIVTVIGTGGDQVGRISLQGQVYNLSFVGDDSIAIDGAKALRVIDLRQGKTLSFPGAIGQIAAVIPGPEDGLLITAEVVGPVRLWHRAVTGQTTTWSTGPEDAYATQQQVHDLDYSFALRALIVRYFGGNTEVVPLFGQHLVSASARQIAVPVIGASSSCNAQYPIIRRSDMGISAASARANVIAYLTEANYVVVDGTEVDPCALLYGNTHNARIAVSGDGRYIATVGAYRDSDQIHGVIVWDLRQLHPLATVLWANDSPVAARPLLALSPDGKIWASVNPQGAVEWSRASIQSDLNPSGWPTALALSADGQELLIGYSNGAVVRVAGSRSRPLLVRLGKQQVDSVWQFAGATYAHDQAGRVWRLSGTQAVALPQFDEKPDDACQYTFESGRSVAREVDEAGKQPTIELHDLTGGAPRKVVLPKDAGNCASLTFSADAQMGVRVPIEHIDMYVVQPNAIPAFRRLPNPLHDISGLRTQLSSPRLSSDGRIMAAIASTDDVALFDVTSGRMLGTLPAPATLALAISADGTRLVTYNSKVGIVGWDLRPAAWAQIARRLAGGEPGP